MIGTSDKLSVRRQSELLEVNRSNIYYQRVDKAIADAPIKERVLKLYEQYPVYGYRRMTACLRREGTEINPKRVRRIMSSLGLRAIYPGPNTSKRNHKESVLPYLLKNLEITHRNQVWQVDITYLRFSKGFMYLTSIIDVYSRKILGWSVSNSLDTRSSLEALEIAVNKYGKPKIINSDQGSQFTSEDWKKSLQLEGVKISMTGKGRSNDNAYIERFWRSLKYEHLHLAAMRGVAELKYVLREGINWYNNLRPHQSLRYRTPDEVFGVEMNVVDLMDKSNRFTHNPTTSTASANICL